MPGFSDGTFTEQDLSRNRISNENYVRKAKTDFEDRRRKNDDTDFAEVNKDEAKEFKLRRYLLRKHSQTGRFGAAKAPEADDSIARLDRSGGIPKRIYFDPFGMKEIHVPVEDEDIIDPEQGEAADLRSDFISRVGTQIDLSRENDFETSRFGEDARLSLGQVISEGQNGQIWDLRDAIETYDAGRGFIPDETPIQDIPDRFDLELIVNDVPPKYTQEWEQYHAEQTQGMKGLVKHFFRKIIRREDPDQNTLFMRFVKTLPEYKRLYSQGEQNAKASGIDYDPLADSALNDFVNNTGKILTSRSLGHAAVRLHAKKYNIPLSSYSFMFASTNNPGMAGAVKGAVSNPAGADSNAVKTNYDIKYSDYLRAAAKIRGTIGSMRTYSIIGYNCTSFATDVAQSAGVPIKDEDTSSYLMTHRHYSQRVDSPYTLARHLEEQNEKKKAAQNADSAEAAYNRSLEKSSSNRKQILYQAYLPRFANSSTVSILLRRHILSADKLRNALTKMIDDTVEKGVKIDQANPTFNLEGEELARALKNQADARKLLFRGFTTEADLMDDWVSNEAGLADHLFSTLNPEDSESLFPSGPIDTSNLDKMVNGLMGTRFYLKHLFSLPPMQGRKRMGKIVQAVAQKQASMRNEITGLLKMSKNRLSFLEQLDRYLGDYTLDMLGESVLTSPDLERFMELSNIDMQGNLVLPKTEKDKGAAEAAASITTTTTTPAEDPTAAAQAETTTTVAAPESEAEKNTTDAEQPAASEESQDAKEAVEEAKKEPEPVPAPDTSEGEKAMIPADFQADHIRQIVFALDKNTAVEAFALKIAELAHLESYSIEKGKRISRGQIVKILSAVASKDSLASGAIMEYYPRIMRSSSMETRLMYFEEMLDRVGDRANAAVFASIYAAMGIS